MASQNQQVKDKRISKIRQTIQQNYSPHTQQKINNHKNQLLKKLPLIKQNTGSILRQPDKPKANQQSIQQSQPLDQSKKIKTIKSVQTKHILKTTNLYFHSKSSTIHQQLAPWTVQNWLPIRSSTTLDRYKININNQQDKQKQQQKNKKHRLGQKKIHQQRNGQTLLRKNSLFLLNYITTKERKVFSKKNLDKQARFIIDKVSAYSSVKMEKAHRLDRQRNFIQNLKNYRGQYNHKNLQQNFQPSPW